MESLKYVDDLIAAERLALTSAYNIFTTRKTAALIHARDCQNFFENVKQNAELIKMKVNTEKTQLLCVSSTSERDINTYIRTENGTKIIGQNSLKQLGFTFGQRIICGLKNHTKRCWMNVASMRGETS